MPHARKIAGYSKSNLFKKFVKCTSSWSEKKIQNIITNSTILNKCVCWRQYWQREREKERELKNSKLIHTTAIIFGASPLEGDYVTVGKLFQSINAKTMIWEELQYLMASLGLDTSMDIYPFIFLPFHAGLCDLPLPMECQRT